MSNNCLFGLGAEFEKSSDLLEAARQAKAAGYTEIEAYSPYEVPGMSEVLKRKSPVVGWILLVGLIVGAGGAFLLQYWTSAVHYPLNIGGRPLNPWPAFLPIMFEAGILIAGVSLVVYMFVRTGLPQPYHPVFNTPGFTGTTEGFYLYIKTTDSKFSMKDTRQFLQGLRPIKVSEVTC